MGAVFGVFVPEKSMLFVYLGCFLVAALTATCLTWLVRNTAFAKGWVSGPRSERHLHNKMIPRLGGVAIAMAPDVAETTRIARPPRGREEHTIQLFRLLQAHELIIAETRDAAHAAIADGDDGTNDLLVSDVLRLNELQVWFINEQLAGAGIADKDEEAAHSAVLAHS